MFKISHCDEKARVGVLQTPHGRIETPAFVAVGTQGSVKALTPQDLREIGVQVIIANTYHLHLRPGEEVIEKMGGLHKFMCWDGPLMTDSGGFQIFSLGVAKEHGVGKIASIFPEEDRGGHLRRKKARAKGESLVEVDDEGVSFRSHIDGSRLKFTPQKVIEIQRKLGADIILALDECTSPLHGYDYTKEAMERTHRWAIRCLEAFESKNQALFGIVQGGSFKDLREKSAKFIGKMGFDGIAIGGSLGKSKQEMHLVLEWTIPHLPEGAPRHLLGIGEVEDIFEVVERGVDLFDCVAPTRMARGGTLFVKEGDRFRLNVLAAKYKEDPKPVEENCGCYTCQHYSRAYLRHLFMAKEPLAMRLATIHNLHFIEKLVGEIREAIKGKYFKDLKREYVRF